MQSLSEGEGVHKLDRAWGPVDRNTNAQIGTELFLSQKTVETHLRNIFNKMRVATRVDLARAVERADRAGSALPR